MLWLTLGNWFLSSLHLPFVLHFVFRQVRFVAPSWVISSGGFFVAFDECGSSCRESRQIGFGVAVSARISYWPEWSLCCDKCCVCRGGLEVLRFGWGAVGDFSNVGFTSYCMFLVQDLVGFSSHLPYLSSLGISGIFSFEYPWHCRLFTFFPYQFESSMCSLDTSTHIPLCSKWDGRHESSSLSSFFGHNEAELCPNLTWEVSRFDLPLFSELPHVVEMSAILLLGIS